MICRLRRGRERSNSRHYCHKHRLQLAHPNPPAPSPCATPHNTSMQQQPQPFTTLLLSFGQQNAQAASRTAPPANRTNKRRTHAGNTRHTGSPNPHFQTNNP